MIGSYLSILSSTNIPYTAYLIVSWKAENAVQVTKTFYNVIKCCKEEETSAQFMVVRTDDSVCIYLL